MKKIQGEVLAVSGPREFDGTMQIGFTLVENNSKWYNIPGEEKQLEEVKKTIVKKGAVISFGYEEETKDIEDLKLVSEPKKSNGDWTEDITKLEDLLSAAHTNFKERFDIRTELVKDGAGNPLLDFEKKYAVFKATVRVWSETDPNTFQIFTGHGEVTKENVVGSVAEKHWIRMAETRAIVRALRWATNNAKVAEEELGGEDGTEDQSAP